MSPGYLDPGPRWPKCEICGGVDLGHVGVIHHRKDCPRNPCEICGLAILPGEKRGAGPWHEDCRIDLAEQLDEDHRSDDVTRDEGAQRGS